MVVSLNFQLEPLSLISSKLMLEIILLLDLIFGFELYCVDRNFRVQTIMNPLGMI